MDCDTRCFSLDGTFWLCMCCGRQVERPKVSWIMDYDTTILNKAIEKKKPDESEPKPGGSND